MSVNRCPRCGHNYYEGGSGVCKWCREEENDRCHICGAQAQCTSSGGYTCFNCAPIAEQRRTDQIKATEEKEENDAWIARCEWEEKNGQLFDDY
jgi:hypothetical protein